MPVQRDGRSGRSYRAVSEAGFVGIAAGWDGERANAICQGVCGRERNFEIEVRCPAEKAAISATVRMALTLIESSVRRAPCVDPF